MENPGRRGVVSELPSVVGVWIFSGTTQYPFKGLLVGCTTSSKVIVGPYMPQCIKRRKSVNKEVHSKVTLYMYMTPKPTGLHWQYM